MKTRMERYKELREKLSSEVQKDTPNQQLSGYAKRLNEIDKDSFDDVIHDETEDYQPTRIKDVELKKYETFENEYLKDFLDEVKEYNIEKGHRHVDDTEQNILEEISAHRESFNETKEPVDFEDLGLVEAKEEKIQTVKSIEEVDFENLLKQVTREHDVVLDESDDDYIIGTSIESDYEQLGEADVEEEIVEETIEEDFVLPEDSSALIDQLGNQNFLDESNQFKTEEMDLKEIFHTSEHDVQKIQDNQNTQFDQDEDHDPFWEDYLKKMNELEQNTDAMFEGERDELNFPTGDKNVQKKIILDNEDEEERDITAEFLALTKEIEKENLTSIDLDSNTTQDTKQDTAPKEENVTQKAVVENTSQDIDVDEYDESAIINDDKSIRNNRLVNAALTVALAGIVLGVAVAIKYFILG
ncbi:MAG TPA: hypothetical protein VFC75_02075 [Erysipelothrix sp.]|nr:hypothetical protein [Erysipelothrix sp.]